LDKDFVMTLAKVVIAAAWADGELTTDEINSMKDLLFHLPELTANQWASIEIYMDSPVNAAERQRLLTELQQRIRSPRERQFAVDALEDMVQADGDITPEEQVVLDQMRESVESVDLDVLSRLWRMFDGRHRAQGPNREQHFEEYVRNRIYYRLKRQHGDTGIEDDQLWRLSLAGALMSRIALVNQQAEPEEQVAIVEALVQKWHINREQAEMVMQVATSDLGKDLDYFRVAREFLHVCSFDELVAFLDVLFAVAAADGMATNEEIEEIRRTANTLKLGHQEFIQAKLRIPAERRAS